jgi:hypothetical protein
MKSAKFERKKIDKAAKPRRVAGVPVRSGIKAGVRDFGRDPGGLGDVGGLFDPF